MKKDNPNQLWLIIYTVIGFVVIIWFLPLFFGDIASSPRAKSKHDIIIEKLENIEKQLDKLIE